MAVARERPEAPELRASTGGCVKGGVSISSLNFGIPRFSLSGWISLFFSFFFCKVFTSVFGSPRVEVFLIQRALPAKRERFPSALMRAGSNAGR